MGEVRSLGAARADRQNDNRLLTPAECCEEAARDIRSGATPCDKVLVLRLNTGEAGASYRVGFNASNLACSETLALLDVARIEILKAMGYLPDADH